MIAIPLQKQINLQKQLDSEIVETTIGKIEHTQNSILLTPEFTRGSSIDLIKLLAVKPKRISALSNVGQTRVDVSKWVNDDTQVIPEKSDIEPTPVDLKIFVGETITAAKLYVGLSHLTVALTTQVLDEELGLQGRPKALVFRIDLK